MIRRNIIIAWMWRAKHGSQRTTPSTNCLFWWLGALRYDSFYSEEYVCGPDGISLCGAQEEGGPWLQGADPSRDLEWTCSFCFVVLFTRPSNSELLWSNEVIKWRRRVGAGLAVVASDLALTRQVWDSNLRPPASESRSFTNWAIGDRCKVWLYCSMLQYDICVY